MVRFLSDTLGAHDSSANAPTPRALALGLPRCATSSLQAALEKLGYGPCMHMAHVQPHPFRQKLVIKALRERDTAKRQKVLRELLAGFGSTADYPMIVFAPDLMDLYPDAPIILNQRRDADDWYQSFTGGLGFFGTSLFKVLTFLVTTDRLMGGMVRATDDLFKERWGEVGFRDREMYDTHNNWIREEAAKRGRKVLDWQGKDGWGPLCEFLGKEVPNEPFPQLNDRKNMKMVKRIIIARGLLYWALLAGFLYAGVNVGPAVLMSTIHLVKG